MTEPRMEPEGAFRVPSGYPRCRRKRCYQPPVADMRRSRYSRYEHRRVIAWWAYCADHLREYDRAVKEGRVWWIGPHDQEADR